MTEAIRGVVIYVDCACKTGPTRTNPRTGECFRCDGYGTVQRQVSLESFAERLSAVLHKGTEESK